MPFTEHPRSYKHKDETVNKRNIKENDPNDQKKHSERQSDYIRNSIKFFHLNPQPRLEFMQAMNNLSTPHILNFSQQLKTLTPSVYQKQTPFSRGNTKRIKKQDATNLLQFLY